MGNPMQAVLSIGGAAFGWIITGGNPAGAAWGCRLDRIPGAIALEAHAEPAGNAQPPAGPVHHSEVERTAVAPL